MCCVNGVCTGTRNREEQREDRRLLGETHSKELLLSRLEDEREEHQAQPRGEERRGERGESEGEERIDSALCLLSQLLLPLPDSNPHAHHTQEQKIRRISGYSRKSEGDMQNDHQSQAAVASRYETYDPRNFPVKTVLWFTRDEIQALKSFSSCNFFLFFLSLFMLTMIGILAATASYPFTIPAGVQVHKTFAGLLVFQIVISFMGYFGIQAENSCVIDMYIASNGILIVSDILVLALFTYFGEFIAQQ